MELNKELCGLFTDEEAVELSASQEANEIMRLPVEVILRVARDEAPSTLSMWLTNRVIDSFRLSFAEIELVMSIATEQPSVVAQIFCSPQVG